MVAIYGSVAIERHYCPDCQRMSLVLDGLLACCSEAVRQRPHQYKKMATGSARRARPSPALQRQLLEEQNGCCLYCDRRFGTTYSLGNRQFTVHLTWDHQIPFVYLQANGDRNWAAACNRCNGWKGSRMFDTVQDVRDYVATRWMRRLTRGMQRRDVRRTTMLMSEAAP